MEVRNEQAAATRQRIVDAARALISEGSADLTLERVAADAGTSVKTVLRKFGSKRGLIVEAVIGSLVADTDGGDDKPAPPRRADSAESLHEALGELFEDYEEIGDRVVWMLEHEHRIDGLREVAETGRDHHLSWVRTVFATALDGLSRAEYSELEPALLVVTDVYVWKLLRRDSVSSAIAAASIMERLVRGLTNEQGD